MQGHPLGSTSLPDGSKSTKRDCSRRRRRFRIHRRKAVRSSPRFSEIGGIHKVRHVYSSRRRACGFTLPEALIAVVIATLACTAMLLAVGQSMQASAVATETTRANLLAQDLMHEISTVLWADATDPSNWGLESDEPATGSRAGFDDLDDYDGWSGPPQTRDGVLYDDVQRSLFPQVSSHEYARYTCTVQVRPLSATGEVLAVGQSSPYRQVTIEVRSQGQAPHRLVRVFADHSGLLGQQHWFEPDATEPLANAQMVPATGPPVVTKPEPVVSEPFEGVATP